MTRIITFTGAQGSGKTTMRKALSMYLMDRGKTVVQQYPDVNESIARDAKELGFTINEETTFMTQYYIASMFIVKDLQLRKLIEAIISVDYIVLDRSVLDVIPYVMVSKNMVNYQKSFIAKMLYNHFELYPTELIYCEPLQFLEKDKDRSVDKEFQKQIVEQFELIPYNVNRPADYQLLEDMSVDDRLTILIAYLGV